MWAWLLYLQLQYQSYFHHLSDTWSFARIFLPLPLPSATPIKLDSDWSLASTYGKIGLFIIASLVGSNDRVIAGLAACGVIMAIVSTAADPMQDFKTGYLTLSSAKSMFLSQLIGTAMGCVIAPLTFWLYWTVFDIGSPDCPYKAPPLVLNLPRDLSPPKISQWQVAVQYWSLFCNYMFVGTVILYVWEQINRTDAEDYAGFNMWRWDLDNTISNPLSIFKINPPICMYFGPSLSS
ncbi:hypothetical protein F0562_004485 [Nyssa sinensis]|uniref:Uncharacterized protein n=1 Tax=Nyssa sinensis TaxID=561372 RepID=A0A5J5C039_9ASTE|nr:hypothetical protein F0562_004485 [Nyssa sinensis]